MNKLIFIFTFFPLFAFGQSNFNFYTENNQLQWQKVYATTTNKSEIEKILKTNGTFKNLTFSENSVSGEIENIPADYKGAGSTGMSTAFYIQNTTINGQFLIEFKDGKYRTTLSGIILRTSNDLSGGGLKIMSANSTLPLSDFALKNSQFRKGFLKSDAKIYDYTFSNLFDFSKYKSNTENW